VAVNYSSDRKGADRVQFVPINLMLGGVAAFIEYGRFFVRPIAAPSISTSSLTG
jgi:hypothetical protein